MPFLFGDALNAGFRIRHSSMILGPLRAAITNQIQTLWKGGVPDHWRSSEAPRPHADDERELTAILGSPLAV